MKYALVFDLGTGSIKASLFSSEGKSIKSVTEDYPTFHVEGNRHEQDPSDWWSHLLSSGKTLLKDFKEKGEIVGIGISGHSLGVVPVDKAGNLLSHRTPIWSDSRAIEEADSFFKTIDPEEWFYETGNGFPPALYSVFKISWIKNNDPSLYERTYKFIGTKDYLNLRLCGVIATDPSYASGTGIYSLKNHAYVERYVSNAGLDLSKFPEIKPSCGVLGNILPEVAQELGIPETVKVVAGGVDNACMTLGAGCYGEGDAYVSLGSSAWVACSSKEPNLDYKRKVYAWEHVVPGMYVPSCGIFSAGTSLEWIRSNMFGGIGYDQINDLVASSPMGSNGVLFNPVMAGGSAVDASPSMKGGFANLTLGTKPADILRAAYEGIAYDVDLAMQAISAGVKLKEPIRAVGGGSNSKEWLDIYANVFGKDLIVTPVKREAATLAAAALVFVGTSVWKDFSKVGEINSKGDLIGKTPQKEAFYKENKARFWQLCKHAADIGE